MTLYSLLSLTLIAIAVYGSISVLLLIITLREVRDVAYKLMRIKRLGPGHHAALFVGLNEDVTIAVPSPELDGSTCTLHVMLREATDPGERG